MKGIVFWKVSTEALSVLCSLISSSTLFFRLGDSLSFTDAVILKVYLSWGFGISYKSDLCGLSLVLRYLSSFSIEPTLCSVFKLVLFVV